MSTSTIAGSERLERREVERGRYRARVHSGRLGIGTAGLVAALVSAWGGIVAFVGPLFNYSGDGSGAWQWNLPHAVLALLPGVAGVFLGLFVMAQARGVTVGRGRLSLAAAGMLLLVCGAWFAVGPLAWPVISHGSAYFVGGTHLPRAGVRGRLQHRDRAGARGLWCLRRRLGLSPSAQRHRGRCAGRGHRRRCAGRVHRGARRRAHCGSGRSGHLSAAVREARRAPHSGVTGASLCARGPTMRVACVVGSRPAP